MPLSDIFENRTYNSTAGLRHTQSGPDTIPEAPPVLEQMHSRQHRVNIASNDGGRCARCAQLCEVLSPALEERGSRTLLGCFQGSQ